MQEDFLQYIWKYKKFKLTNLKTTKGKDVILVSTGEHNTNSGPDFFNAQLHIEGQLWAGNVEIHIKSSEWYVHHHETDSAYDNVVLHVVWEHDSEIFRKDNSEIDTLELKHYVSKEALHNYQRLFNKSKQWINCESDFTAIDGFVIDNWLERLYFERLERKRNDISLLLKQSNNDWELVLFKMLAKNFGLKVNGEAFLSVAESIDFSVVRKEASKPNNLEALFFGQGGLLIDIQEDVYYNNLKAIYSYQKHKYNLQDIGVLPIQFFRLRPLNFPTIRLSQLAELYSKSVGLFSTILNTNSKETIYNLFNVSASVYWQTHYTFSKTSKHSKKQLSKAFIDLLIINTIIPIKFSYSKQIGKPIEDKLLKLISDIKPEKNSIVDKFSDLKKDYITSALKSQSLIELKTNYCAKHKCMQCAVGNVILSS